MAATNFTPIQLYHSTTASAVPVNTNLVDGELAINIADGKLYYKDSGGTVQVIASKATGTIGGSTTQVQYNSSGALAGSANFTFNGTTATINTLNLTNALGAAYGGTAQSTYTQGDLLYASAANTLSKLAIGSNTYILTSNGTIPGWAAPSSISVNTATNLAGGAGGSVPYQSGAGATTFLSIGTANQVMTSSGSLPQWSSGLSITTLTASDAVTFSATTQNIALGTSQTTGTFTVGGAAQTGTQTFDQSTKTHTLNLGTGATESGLTKTINLGTAGVSGSTTAINIGSANGTSTTLNGTVTAATLNSTTIDTTNIEVTNIKAKDGTAALSIADSTGVVSVSANPILSGGTANGILYLNGSKSATSGSALTFDGTRLGIGSTANTEGMLTVGTGTVTDKNGIVLYRGAASSVSPTQVAIFNELNGIASGESLTLRSPAGFKFQNNDGSSEWMRLNSTSLNIGGNFTSTNNTLQVTGNAAIGYTTAAPTTGLIVAGNVGVGTDTVGQRLTVVGTANDTAQFQNSVSYGTVLQVNATATGGRNWKIHATANGDGVVGGGYFSIIDATANAYRLNLDSSGNLGLGVTPSAWNSNYKAFQVGTRAVLTQGSSDTYLGNNWYNDGANKYLETAAASIYGQAAGAHQWFTAPSGTAGNTISFTQAMTLDADGDLGVGTTNPTTISNYRAITVNGTNGGILDLKYGDALGGRVVASSGGLSLEAGGANVLTFYTNNSERARITSGGDLLVAKTAASDSTLGVEMQAAGTVVSTRSGSTNSQSTLIVYSTGASAYRFYVGMDGTVNATNTTISAISDQRLKENIQDLDVGLDKIMALKPRKFDWKEGKGKNIKGDRGWIAQEFEQVFPDMIDEWKDPAPEGEEPYKSVRADLIPVLVKAIQEQQAMINELKAEVAALKGA
jgi:hypothetical protein